MAGLADASKINEAKTADECVTLCNDSDIAPGVRYARIFAECNGRGPKEAQAYEALVKVYGEGKASSVRAMCWFLQWGSFTGNTLNGILGLEGKAVHSDAGAIYKSFFVFYYGILFFGLVNIVGLGVKAAPRVPVWFSRMFGVILATLAGSFFTPLGLLGICIGVDADLKTE